MIYDNNKENEIDYRVKYYNIKYRYLNYDDKVFKEFFINLTIVKFRGRKRINTLKAFSL